MTNCPRCKGKVFRDGLRLYCINCGHTVEDAELPTATPDAVKYLSSSFGTSPGRTRHTRGPRSFNSISESPEGLS